MQRDDDEIKLGRFRQSEIDYAIRGLFSGRVGPRGRTFHLQVKTIGRRNGGVAKAIAGLNYDSRQGEHAGRRDELEAEGGRSREQMTEAIQAAEQANVRANAKLVLRGEIELPAEFPAPARLAVANRLGAWFEDRGCPAHWAIHRLNSRKVLQPHIHWSSTARPVRMVDGEWVGTASGSRGRGAIPAVIDGREAMRAFRRDIAGIINTVAVEHAIDLGAEWHGGRLEETGIVRPAKARLPMSVYKATATKRPNPRTNSTWAPEVDGPASSNRAIEAGAYAKVDDNRRAWRRQLEAARLAAADAADQARLDRLERERQALIARQSERHATARRRRRDHPQRREDTMPTTVKPLTAAQAVQIRRSLEAHQIPGIRQVLKCVGSDHRVTTIAWKLYSVRDAETTTYLKEQLALRMAQIAAYSGGGGSNGAAESGKFRPNVRQVRPIAAATTPAAAQASSMPAPAATPNETAWGGMKSYAELAAAYSTLEKGEKDRRYAAVSVVAPRDNAGKQRSAASLKSLDSMDLALAYHKTAAFARRIELNPRRTASEVATAAGAMTGLTLLRAEMKRRGIDPPAQKTVVRERARDFDR